MIKEQLLQDLKTAMREKDTLRRDMLQISRAAVLQTEKDSQTELDEAGVMALIAKEVKKREELLSDLENSDRQDIIDRTNAEIAVFKAYLPEQMDETQVEEIVRKAIATTGAVSARDMGMVMKAVIPEIAGRADNKLVNQVVRRLLT
ncbi:MAG: GatB/YqeY domain-containing protein [Ruminococcaceae bacterium]|nr:GatB/YqeY domain-containing protein [Oscillospiraceae bacterium]